MSLAYSPDRSKPVQLGWYFDTDIPQNLSLMLEQKARRHRDAPGFIFPYPDYRANGSNFSFLGFDELAIEQNAWVNYLSNRGVKQGDVVVVWLPYSVSLVTVSYALFKIGAQAVILDPEFNWKVGYRDLQKLDPRHLVGTRSKLYYSKFFGSPAVGPVNRIEVENPQSKVGSGIRSFKARSTFWEKQGEVTLMRTVGRRCQKATFEHDQLCRMAALYKDWFGLQGGDRCLPGNLLEALLFPAAGLASMMVVDHFSDESYQTAKLVMKAMARFEVALVSGNASFWKTVSLLAVRKEFPREAKFEAVVRGTHYQDCDLDTLNAAMLGVSLNLVFGSYNSPFLACRKWSRRNERKREHGFRGIYLGKPLPGLDVITLPTGEIRWVEEEGASSEVGEIAVAKKDFVTSDEPKLWKRSGVLGFFDHDGELWYCGDTEDAIGTSFGGFCPVRCEAIFNQHPRVQRSILIALQKNGKTRPGLVVETKVGELPKRGVEESRFKAELLQIAADCEETAIVLDIFFSDSLPLEDGGLESVDRKRLSKEYSKRIRL
ncbi:AMP-binding protein [Pelagicoccus albus]|uniref:AMP-binding protein n=1 Tax=Pelagicoccus albus TaxID=415222 RepID=A0A7X1B6U2_9BACT|nr:AMP-binding protein [Pelagicoccus albus]MBC2606721.1 AMP-binding protein [Pelagicoccus albus]